MEVIKRSVHVPFSAEQMFKLINDIESYPQFLPWCRQAKIHYQTEEEVQATLVMAKGPIHHSFTTKNRIRSNHLIDMQLIDGPFRHLEGFWHLDPKEEQCLITFELEYQFVNHFVSLALGPFFRSIITPIIDAFKKRAQQLYGTRHVSSH